MTLEKKFFPVEVFQVTDVLGNNTKTNKKKHIMLIYQKCIMNHVMHCNRKHILQSQVPGAYNYTFKHLKSYYSYLRHCFNRCF